jgi:hypothetical protein
MRANVSSRTTWFLKFAFPVIWTAILALGAIPMFGDSARGHGAKLPAALTLAAVWLIGATLLFLFSGSLMRVEYRDGRLYASNFRREIEILPGDIAAITQNVWINVRPVTIQLRTATELGRRIRFIPPSRVIFRFWAEDPIVSELRAFAQGAPAERLGSSSRR